MNKSKVDLHIASDEEGVPSKKDFQSWVRAVMQEFNEVIELCIRVVESKESQALNFAYRKKNKPTNVLSFSYGLEARPLLGDLIMCREVVLEEAAVQHQTPAAHFAHMTVHGMLHLLGFDHETPEEAQVMEAKEVEILKKLGFDDPYSIC